jgi:putative addiction module component (TIGR02574 family)
MERGLKDIVQNIMLLPKHVRAYLAEILLESLDYEEDFPISEEWIDEITRRCREIDEGSVDLIPGEEGFAQLRRRSALV